MIFDLPTKKQDCSFAHIDGNKTANSAAAHNLTDPNTIFTTTLVTQKGKQLQVREKNVCKRQFTNLG